MEATKVEKQIKDSHAFIAPKSYPWLIICDGKYRDRQIFYDISNNRYDKESIPEMCNKLIYACSHGWLVLVDSNSKIVVFGIPSLWKSFSSHDWNPLITISAPYHRLPVILNFISCSSIAKKTLFWFASWVTLNSTNKRILYLVMNTIHSGT